MSERAPRWRQAILALIVFCGLVAPAEAATLRLVSLDGPGEGLNDPTPAAPVGGNLGTTLGEQRRLALEYAMQRWGERLASPVEIRVAVAFDPLPCSLSSVTLGAAQPVSMFADFAGAPQAGTFYAAALADHLAGFDLAPEEDDIDAVFNSAFGTTCPFPAGWYYGLDARPPGEDSDFVTAALHELGHGLGFLSRIDVRTGELAQAGTPDVFLRQLVDTRNGLRLDAMTDAQRRSAARARGFIVWDGSEVVAASGDITAGVDSFGRVEVYTPALADPAASLSHWSDAVRPAQLMAPFLVSPVHELGLSLPALADIGWTLSGAPGCGGDCDASGAVTIEELIRAIGIALGEVSLDVCPAIDGNGDGAVGIGELVDAVNSALNGCPR